MVSTAWRRRKSSRCRLVNLAPGAGVALVFAALSRASFWRIISSILVSTSDTRCWLVAGCGGGVAGVGLATPWPGGGLGGVEAVAGAGLGLDSPAGGFEGFSSSARAF